MFKGTNASAGIGIGKAAIIKENELVIRPEKVIDGAAEVERFKGALEQTIQECCNIRHSCCGQQE